MDLIIEIESFEQKCASLKGLFQLDQLKQHMMTIGFDQLLGNCEMYKHRFLENSKKLYKSSGKCNYYLQLKLLLKASMVYIT